MAKSLQMFNRRGFLQNHHGRRELQLMNPLELSVGVKGWLDLSGNMSKDKETEPDVVTAYILIVFLKCS